MDCCRTSRRLGGRDIKVMARRPRPFFKASPWELDDAEEEGVEILVNHAPTRFVIERADSSAWSSTSSMGRGGDALDHARHGGHSLRRRHPRHRPRELLPLDRARPRHDLWRVGHARRRRGHDGVERARRLLRRRRGVGSEEHHLGRGPRPRRPRSPSTTTATTCASTIAGPWA